MQVEGINDINQVEQLRNTPIYIEEIEEDELTEDEYFINDMIGCEVVDDKG
jgi:16S rRNA processing protein RimM